jgi:hypothetical protein
MFKRWLCAAFGHMFHYNADHSISCTGCGEPLHD